MLQWASWLLWHHESHRATFKLFVVPFSFSLLCQVLMIPRLLQKIPCGTVTPYKDIFSNSAVQLLSHLGCQLSTRQVVEQVQGHEPKCICLTSPSSMGFSFIQSWVHVIFTVIHFLTIMLVTNCPCQQPRVTQTNFEICTFPTTRLLKLTLTERSLESWKIVPLLSGHYRCHTKQRSAQIQVGRENFLWTTFACITLLPCKSA